MKPTQRISEAEWQVMEILWEENPLTANHIIKRLSKTRWAANTVRTLLARLTKKKIVASAKEDAAYQYRPTITREQCVQGESDSFLKRVFAGSSQPLLVHFAQKAKLTPEEITEIKSILDQKGKQK